tara:strand:- start:1172 stop:2116 length:945 start_codon:yes stop_codon:yes gene_type:complete
MIEELIFLVLGLAGLWIGADFLIKGSKNIAEHFGISHFLIGLAFISIGTSIPEIAVSIAGGLERLAGLETSGIVVGNKIGSALSQITLLFGILAFLVPLRIKKEVVFKQGGFLIASVLLVFALASDGFLSPLDGFIALGAYFCYYVYLWSNHIQHKKGRPITLRLLENIVYAITGIGLVLLTSNIVVKNGISFAESLGVSQSLVGILLIGLGTGLPELSVALASFKHKAMGISIGDLIGSNICDLLLALGAGTIISGFLVEPSILWFDLPVLLAFCVITLSFLYRKGKISKLEGAILISLFVAYALIKIFLSGN